MSANNVSNVSSDTPEMSNSTESKTQDQINRFIDDIDAMINFITTSGKNLQTDIAADIAEMNCHRNKLGQIEKENNGDFCSYGFSLVLRIHSQLSTLIAPVTPTSLRATERIGKHFKINNSAINNLIYITLTMLAGFIISFIITQINIDELYKQSIKAANIFFAAGLGAGFYSLSTSRTYILQRTFDPQYNQAYYIRFVLGLAAGTILGYLGNNMLDGNLPKQLGSSVLAIVGGYSSDAVSQILQRLAETLVTIVRGSNKDVVEEKERQAKATALQTVARDKNETVKKLQKILGSAEGSTKKEIEGIIDTLLS